MFEPNWFSLPCQVAKIEIVLDSFACEFLLLKLSVGTSRPKTCLVK